jgi:hypothetical protein
MQILAASFAGVTGSYESIATTTVGVAGSATLTFSSIPSTYKHLQLRISARSNRALANDNLGITFNGDGSAAYSNHTLYTNGATITAYGDSTLQVGSFECNIPAATATASVFGCAIIDILDYANTSKNKTLRDLSGFDSNGSGVTGVGSSYWSNTNAITSITIVPRLGLLLSQYSSFALYGIKG